MGVEAALIGGGAALLGSAIAGKSARSAAQTSADAQMQAAAIAAEAQKFRPVGVTTRFGTSQFGFDDSGYLTSAGYTPTPEIKALQDRLSALYGTSLGQAETAAGLTDPYQEQARRLFNLGTGYISESPEAARLRIFNQLQDVRRPSQIQEEQRLAAGAFGRGRTGLNISGMGQPELYTLARAREAQRAADVLAAEDAAQGQIKFGTGLLSTAPQIYATPFELQTKALGPFQQQFGTTQLLEQSAQQPLDIGAQLGGRAATAGQSVGQTLLTGGMGAAQTQLTGSLVGPTLFAQNLSGFGQQYLQGQQRQQLFDQLYGINSPWGRSDAGMISRGVNLYGGAPSPAGNWYSQTPTDFIMP